MSEKNPIWTSQWIMKDVQMPVVATAPRGQVEALGINLEKGDVIRWDAETREFRIRKSGMSGIEGRLAFQICRYSEPDEHGKVSSSTSEAPKAQSLEQARALVLVSPDHRSVPLTEALAEGRGVTRPGG